MQAREKVKTMKTEAQVKSDSGSEHDGLELDDLDLDIFAPKPVCVENKDKLTSSDNSIDDEGACESPVVETERKVKFDENSLRNSTSGSDSSSELGDDFELVKDNRESATEFDPADENESKTSELIEGASSHLNSSSGSLPNGSTWTSKHMAIQEENFPVTKGGLQKSKV